MKESVVTIAREQCGGACLMIDDYVERPPGYVLDRIIGRGSFSECWLARHELSGCPVAIKKISRSRSDGRLLEREVNTWLPLEHPNILQLYEVIPLHDSIYLAMEWAESGELFSLLAAHPKGLPQNMALNLFSQICEAVHYLHGKGVAHRDLKLENIMLSENQSIAKVGDFGFACVWTGNGSNQCKEWLGSPEYSAPELLINAPYDPIKADCWSLGVILYALFTGYLPFSGLEDDCGGIMDVERKIRHRVINKMYEIPHGFPPELIELLQGLLEYDVATRWDTSQMLSYPSINKVLASTVRGREQETSQVLERLAVAELKGIERLKLEGSQGPSMALRRILLRTALCEYPQIRLTTTTEIGSSLTSPGLSNGLQLDKGTGSEWFKNLGLFKWGSKRYKNVGDHSNSGSRSEEDISVTSQ